MNDAWDKRNKEAAENKEKKAKEEKPKPAETKKPEETKKAATDTGKGETAGKEAKNIDEPKKYRQQLLNECLDKWPSKDNPIEFGVTELFPKGINGENNNGISAERCLVREELPKIGTTVVNDWLPLAVKEFVAKDAGSGENVDLPKGTLKIEFARKDEKKEPDIARVYVDFGKYFEQNENVPRKLDVIVKAEHSGQFEFAPEIHLRINVNEPGIVLAEKENEGITKEVANLKGWDYITVEDPRENVYKDEKGEMLTMKFDGHSALSDSGFVWAVGYGVNEDMEDYTKIKIMPMARLPKGIDESNMDEITLTKNKWAAYNSKEEKALFKMVDLDMAEETVKIIAMPAEKNVSKLKKAVEKDEKEAFIEYVKEIQKRVQEEYGKYSGKPKYLLILGDYYDIPLVDISGTNTFFDYTLVDKFVDENSKKYNKTNGVLDSGVYANMDGDMYAELATGRLPLNGNEKSREYFKNEGLQPEGGFNAILITDKSAPQLTPGGSQKKYIMTGTKPKFVQSQEYVMGVTPKPNEIVTYVNPEKGTVDAETINKLLAESKYCEINSHGCTQAFARESTTANMEECTALYCTNDIPKVLLNRPVIATKSCSTVGQIGRKFMDSGTIAYLGCIVPCGSTLDPIPATHKGEFTTVGDIEKDFFNLHIFEDQSKYQYAARLILLGDPSIEWPQLRKIQAESIEINATEKKLTIKIPKLNLEEIFHEGFKFTKKELKHIKESKIQSDEQVAKAGFGLAAIAGFKERTLECEEQGCVIIKNIELYDEPEKINDPENILPMVYVESDRKTEYSDELKGVLQEKTAGENVVLLALYPYVTIDFDVVDGELFLDNGNATYELPFSEKIIGKISQIKGKKPSKIKVGENDVELPYYAMSGDEQPSFYLTTYDILILIKNGALENETIVTYEFS